MMIDTRFAWLVVSAAAVFAATTDLRRFRIPNAFTLALLIAGLVYQGAVGGWAGFGASLAGAGFGFAVLLVPYAAGGMGAGDVKFLAGVGAWLGLPATLAVLVASAIATVVYALCLAVARGGLAETSAGIRKLLISGAMPADLTVERTANRPDRRRWLVPFAAMVGVGMVLLAAWVRWTGEPPFGLTPPWRLG